MLSQIASLRPLRRISKAFRTGTALRSEPGRFGYGALRGVVDYFTTDDSLNRG